jgi:ketosteroid isomerase-like protein
MFACSSSAKDDTKKISNVLNKQSAAWNSGDIQRYMHGYWNNDSLQFIGKNGPVYGYTNTLARYKKSYPDTGAMGQLTFSELHFNKLSGKYYHVTGHWALERAAGNVGGYFTLLFRKIKGEWVIVADHSS